MIPIQIPHTLRSAFLLSFEQRFRFVGCDFRSTLAAVIFSIQNLIASMYYICIMCARFQLLVAMGTNLVTSSIEYFLL